MSSVTGGRVGGVQGSVGTAQVTSSVDKQSTLVDPSQAKEGTRVNL